MDGLSISNIENFLDTAKINQRKLENLPPVVVEKDNKSSVSNLNTSFAQTFNDAISSVDRSQKNSEKLMTQLATGQKTDVAEVMIAVEKSEIAFQLLTQVRNKIINAYQEVMKMQV